MKERVSIALATFNGGQYLPEQLQSFLTQTQTPDELVICDDGSTDATASIVEKFAEAAPFEVRFWTNEANLGYAQNFSRALGGCTGDIVFISDQDDVWLPDKIERMMHCFSAEPQTQLLIHDLEYCKADLTPIGQTKIERMQGQFDLHEKFVVGMATAVRGSFLRRCLPVPGVDGLAHDAWLHGCAQVLNKKRILYEVLARYRRHGVNATAADSLNVDFVTDARHFKAGALKNRTFLSVAQSRVLYEWLCAEREALIQLGCTTATDIDEAIAHQAHKVERITARCRILAMSRWRRIVPVLMFWGRGGYRCFSGWKSALKDVLAN
ncbi:MAG: glycosyltransferase family 2 protein [Desulfuromonadaceae bacterium]|nr:glycosyltransferase family 2 protein [Desulfuromonadaceae bacterium]